MYASPNFLSTQQLLLPLTLLLLGIQQSTLPTLTLLLQEP